MSDPEGARPQDLGRPHRSTRGAPAPATVEVLERYRAAMRDELGEVLVELRPDLEQLTVDGSGRRLKPALAERLRLWELAIKLGRELAAPGAEPDWTGETSTSSSTPAKAKAGRAPRLSARERRALGG